MMNYVKRMASWIDARNLRERGLLFALLIILFAFLAHRIFLLAPLQGEQRLIVEMSKTQAETRAIHDEIQKLAGQTQTDPDAQKNAILKKLRDEDGAALATISNLRGDLVAPEQMPAMLEAILARQGAQLQLLSLNKLPLQSLIPATLQPVDKLKSGAPAAALVSPDPVYKHGVEIVVQGRYFDLLDYLVALEKVSAQLIWGKLELKVDAYPMSTMRIQLFTLSLDKQWMNL